VKAGCGPVRGALEISHQLGHFINNTNKLSLGRNGLDDAAAINELFCDYNTQVKKGQVCARIDPRPLRDGRQSSEGEPRDR
jgi:hypothetical protein